MPDADGIGRTERALTHENAHDAVDLVGVTWSARSVGLKSAARMAGLRGPWSSRAQGETERGPLNAAAHLPRLGVPVPHVGGQA